MRKNTVCILLATLSLLMAGTAQAEEKGKMPFQQIEFLTGYSWGKLRAQDNYNMFPLAVAFDFDLKGLTKKVNFDPNILLQFQIEPYIGTITSPISNVEMGNSFFFKAGLAPQTWKIQPYIKAGTGISYMSLHTREQSTQFNFISSGALGMHYFFRENMAFTLEGRYRHLSNAGIDHPNSGINTAFILAGVALKF